MTFAIGSGSNLFSLIIAVFQQLFSGNNVALHSHDRPHCKLNFSGTVFYENLGAKFTILNVNGRS